MPIPSVRPAMNRGRRGLRHFVTFLAATIVAAMPRPMLGEEQPNAVPESPAIAAVAKAVAGGDKTAMDRFWSKLQAQHTPLVETIPGDPAHVLASFVWKGDDEVRDVVLMAQPDGIAALRDPRSHLLHVASTDIWYRTHKLPLDAEFSYWFSVNPPPERSGAAMMSTFHSDPLNPLHYQVLTGPVRSIARMPGVPANPWTEDHGAPVGKVEERTIVSKILKQSSERQLWVYQTPGEIRSPNVLILLDGTIYAKAVPAARILDNLFAAHDIGPTIAVLVKDGKGDAWRTDMYYSNDFVAFLADELLPWLQREYGFKADPKRTVVGGESIAGLTAAFAALKRPDVFHRVLSQSASFWLNNRDADNGEPEWLARQFLQARKMDLTFWIDVGEMEFVPNEADRIFPPFVPGTTSLLAANRHLRDILRAKGYKVTYVENYADHEPLRWSRTLPQALIATLGPG